MFTYLDGGIFLACLVKGTLEKGEGVVGVDGRHGCWVGYQGKEIKVTMQKLCVRGIKWTNFLLSRPPKSNTNWANPVFIYLYQSIHLVKPEQGSFAKSWPKIDKVTSKCKPKQMQCSQNPL